MSTLDLRHNLLSGTVSFNYSDTLIALYLTDNLLTGTIPPFVGNIIGLYELGLNDNRLGGTIPDTIGSLINLEELYLDNIYLLVLFLKPCINSLCLLHYI
uniref:Leucine-rich repeat-containing N-terminal plant-type domain-containing protein n=1 Tax=Arcella intermedia TaxID=1963864 RepID=A0A6B2LPI0_9EUKA